MFPLATEMKKKKTMRNDDVIEVKYITLQVFSGHSSM